MRKTTDRTRWRQQRVPALGLVAILACGGGGERRDDRSAAGAGQPPVDTGGAPAPAPREDVVDADTAEGATAPAETSAAGGSWTVGDTSVPKQVSSVPLLRAVRTARHDGYDRIVLDLGDGPIPSYRISYIDRPVRACGSGDVVPLRGDAWLEITLEPANAHTEEGQPTVTDRRRRPDLPNVLDLVLTCDFEAQVQWVAGVRSPERYRVLELRAPARLVVDVRHPR